MKKLVIKTVVITLAVVFVFTGITYVIFAAANPFALAKFYDNTGNYSLTVKYLEKNYKKSNSYEDLAYLCGKLDERSDAERTALYVDKFINDGDFDGYCSANGSDGGYAMTVEELYFGKLVVALYLNDGIDSAVAKACDYVDKYGYTDSNPFYILIIDGNEKFDQSAKNTIKTNIQSFTAGLEGSQLQYAERDLQILLS